VIGSEAIPPLATIDEPRLKIAYFSPLPPQRSGVADYSRELLPYLASLAELTVFVSESKQINSSLRERFDVRDLSTFALHRHDFDLPLYHIGNSEYHDEISRFAVQYPGVIVLHDFYLHHATAQRTLGAGNPFGYAREMGYASGAAGVRQALAVQDNRLAPPLFSVPLNNRPLDASLGVIVHSQYTAQLVRDQGYDRALFVLPAPIEDRPVELCREKLGLTGNEILLASFGLITAEKQIAAVLHALRVLRDEQLNVHYLLVGNCNDDVPLDNLLREYGVEDAVHHIGFVPDIHEFICWIHTADVVVNLRYPSVGETSATALRALIAGRPLLVYDHGWYAELPQETAVRVKPLDDGALLSALRELASAPDLRLRLGRAGHAYAAEVHSPATVALGYVSTLQATVQACGLPANAG